MLKVILKSETKTLKLMNSNPQRRQQKPLCFPRMHGETWRIKEFGD